MHQIKSLRIIFGLSLTASFALAQQYTISTVAGTGTVRGWYGDGGLATSAQLDYPTRVAIDAKGNVFVADYLTQVVREFTVGGNISTIAGTGQFGFQGDNGAAVQGIISDVHGISGAPNATVYISDTHNARVRQIIPAGNIYTIAGNGVVGYAGDGGPATSAQLSQPSGVAVDSAGNIYIADYGNYTVRKVDTKGNISTVAGVGAWGYSGDGGPANKAALASPSGLAFDSAGNLYISDVGNLNIRKITPDGNIQTVATNVTAETIAVDAAGSIYYPDFRSSTVRKILSNGTRYTIAGNGTAGFSGDGGAAASAQLSDPHGVAVDSSGNVYVADSGNMVIRKLTPVASSVTIVNAASGVGASISPGEIVTIFGVGIGPATPVTAQPGTNGFGTQAGGVTVTFGGTNGVVLYASSSQINAIVPYEVPIGGTPDVVVSYQGQSFTAAAVPVAGTAPGIFTLDATGSGEAAVVNQNGTVNGPANPAQAGSIVSLYVTGEGPTTPGGVNGKLAVTPLPQPQSYVAVFLSGQQVSVAYAGGAPGEVAGVMQINVQIPANLLGTTTGTIAVPVTLQIGSLLAQSNVTLYVTR